MPTSSQRVLTRLGDFRVQLGLVALGGLGVRLWALLAWQRHQPLMGDQVYYHHGARALRAGAGYVNPFAWETSGGTEEIASALHPPGYATYLAFWSLLGLDTPTGHKIASALLGVLTIVLAGLLARRLAPDRVAHGAGIAAAAVAALYPNLWINDGALVSESLHAPATLGVLLAAYAFRDRPGWRQAAVLGALVAVATLVRAEAGALFVLLVLPLVLMTRDRSWRDRLGWVVVAGGVGAALMAPWVVRNMVAFDPPGTISNGSGFVIEIANCDVTYSGEHLGYWNDECDRDHTWLPEVYGTGYGPARNETVIEREKRAEGLDYISDHLSDQPRVMAARIGRMWDVFRPTQNIGYNAFLERRGLAPSALGLVAYWALLPVAAIAFVSMWRRRITLIPFVAVALSVTIAAAMSFGITRYRVSVDAALAVLGGIGLAIAWDRLRGRFWPSVAVLGGLGLFVRFANVLVVRPTDGSCRASGGCFAIGGDALYSHLQGELLAQGHGFASSFAFWVFSDIQPGAGDPPLYVLYLGLVSALHGSGGVAAGLVGLLALVGAVAAVWLVVRRRHGDLAGRRAGLLAAVVALAVVLVAVVPTLWADGVGAEAGGGPTITLNDGSTATAASVDHTAVVAHRLASALLGAAGAVLLGLVGRRIAGPRAGLIAAGLAAIHPLLWINDAMVLSESLYVPMVAVTILAAYRFWDRPGPWSAALLGVTAALAALTRAEALFLFVALVPVLAWGRRREIGGVVGAGRLTIVAGLAGLILVLPWMAWNMVRFEEPATMTSQTGAVLSAGACDVAFDGPYVGLYAADCFQQYVDEGWTVWPDPRAEESVRDVPAREGAVRYLEENADEIPRVVWFRVLRMWDLYKTGQNVTVDYNVEGRGKWESWSGTAMYFLLLPLAGGGIVVMSRRRIPVSPLLAQAAVVTVTAAATFGVTRYRVPVDAVMVVAAAVAIDAMTRRRWPVDQDGTVTPRPDTGSPAEPAPGDGPDTAPGAHPTEPRPDPSHA